MLLLKNSFHTNLCSQLVNDIQLKRSNYFYFLGKITDQVFDTISETKKSEFDTRSEMIYGKKIQASDVSFVTKRYDWVSGTLYTQYDSTIDNLAELNYYVLTSDFNVYKCLDNNYGVLSTVEPTDTGLSTERTSDGYLWKFMYHIPLYKRNKFLTTTKMPVQTAISDSFYNFGAINNVTVITGGSDYLIGDTTISIVGDGIDAILTPVISAGEIVSVDVTDPGSGYSYLNATVVSGSGTGATLEVIFQTSDFISSQSTIEQTTVSGAIYKIVITNGGTQYFNPTIMISGDGTGATAELIVTEGVITKINILTEGINYTYATATISHNDIDRQPSAIDATAYVIISPVGGHGKDAVEELNATGVCLYSNIRILSSGITSNILNQDFREYGIVRNIRDIYSNNLVYSISGMFAFNAVLNTLVDLIEDEILVSGTSKFKVVKILNSTQSVMLAPISTDTISISNTLAALNNISRIYTVESMISLPFANKYSGQLLFLSNTDPFTFSDEQEATIKTYLNL